MKHLTSRRWLAGATAALIAASIAPAHAGTRNLHERLQKATRYLAMNQEDDGSISGGFSRLGTTSDAILAFASEMRGKPQVRDAMGWLEEHVEDATTLGLKAKLVLAAVAVGRDPRSFGGRDLVQEIMDTHDPETGQYGGESDTEVGYHALAMLAVMAGREDPPESASRWLRDAQCDDGGWQFDEPAGPNDDEHCFDSTAENDFSRSDTNTTAYADMAFEGSPGPDPKVDPISFLRTARDDYKKGFVYDPHGKCTEETLGEQFCYLTDANSTGLVLQAMLGEVKAKEFVRYRDALMKLQYPRCGKWMGAFAFTWIYD
ncbi:MAG TPA: hypothetical protein VEV43_06055, partial [Actinomycetota bacterium]|nr:hypothetical protein [Actinomycetota bacterium]